MSVKLSYLAVALYLMDTYDMNGINILIQLKQES